MPPITRRCSKCKETKSLSEFYKNKFGKRGFLGHCKVCQNLMNRKFRDDPRNRLYVSSKLNASKKGVIHTIKPADIRLPKICKYLGVVIDYRRADERGTLRSFDAPSIDRINPTLGYVPGNIQVISDLANRMKQDATPEQLLAFAEGIFRVHGSR